MKIERKKGVQSFRIVGHNKKVLAWIIILVILLTAVLIFMNYYENSNKIIGGDKDSHGCLIGAGYSWCEEKQKCLRVWEESCGDQCYANEDCVASSCCHSSSCVISTKAPNCTGRFCTEQCKNGTLDCGQASCGCINGSCSRIVK